MSERKTIKLIHRSDRESERGAILPIMALLLVSLLVMAAIVIDLGAARETRRRNQGSGDAAALAGAQDLPNRTSALTTAINVAASDLGLTTAQVATALNSCGGGSADPNALAVAASVSTAGANENCVSFDAGAGEIRVYYRGSYVTSFAKVIGATSISINNGATAAKADTSGFGGVLPFGIPAGAGVGEVCLKTSSPGGEVGACHGPSAGNFNYLDVAQYGNAVLGTPQRCNTGSHDALLRDNVAMGIDHLLTNYTGTATADAYITCDTYTPSPNEVATETGNVANVLTPPLLTDGLSNSNESDGKGARLRRGGFVCTSTNAVSGWATPYSCQTVEGVNVDDVPLWHFIGIGSSHTGMTDVPTLCSYATFTGIIATDVAASASSAQMAFDTRSAMDACFANYELGGVGVGCSAGHSPCRGILFGYNTDACGNVNLFDIQCTPRFGYTPEVCNTIGVLSPLTCTLIYPSGSSGNVFITERRPIFIQRLTNDNAADSEVADKANSLDDEPGVKYSESGSRDVTNLVAFNFDRNMLPGSLGDPDAPNETDVNAFVSLVR